MPTIDRWLETWRGFAVEDSPRLRIWYDDLISCYSEPHRHYHTLQHLDECFARFDELRGEARHAEEIELALWFHDAVYDTKATDNELRSADLARRRALEAGVSTDAAGRVHALVLSTKHDARPDDIDARIVVDVDLAILGADRARFAEYEQQVRAEYAWVPGFVFRRNRRKLLDAFLARPSIFNTARFVEKYEARARQNISRGLGG